MRTAGIYLVEAEIGTARIAGLPQSDILLTLRIGTPPTTQAGTTPQLTTPPLLPLSTSTPPSNST